MNLKIEDCRTLVGLDIGSTTAKIIVVKNGDPVFEKYERHFSQVRKKALELIVEASEFLDGEFYLSVSGSAGLGIARSAGIPFVQEVYATGEVVKNFEPDTSVVIELGGEDAKIIFFDGMMEERMNGSCAGGTGAFIDQMATLLDVTPDELDILSIKHSRIYPIASRCGVFAKSDIQPLLNQGASKEDIAASIYQAVVNQTIVGLAQGRRITGKVMFLGGPLHYCKGLRDAFRTSLELDEKHAICPEYDRYAVALGAAIYAGKQTKSFLKGELIEALQQVSSEKTETKHLPPLFQNQNEYNAFIKRHSGASIPTDSIETFQGDCYLGIDCGSTTTKIVLIGDDGQLIYSYYDSNRGNPVDIVRHQIKKIYRIGGDRIRIRSSAVTGYGEDLIRNAFDVDFGIVETMAHFTAARYFKPDVDFIIDIGGQDIKCFRIHNQSIDSIMLNEACSSGCGSFIETFAKNMGCTVEEFSKLGLFAAAPVDLGSRCTVFMNSSVKQAQKDGADIGDISAGLSISVVKNAIYKVIRVNSAAELGRNVVVQGGTFLNDSVLRAFERELGCEVVRPQIAGLMGAFGAALYAKKNAGETSSLISRDAIQTFIHSSKSSVCHGCTNRCSLTINTFSGDKRFISGNRCEKALGLREVEDIPNLYQFKRDLLSSIPTGKAVRGKVGMPLALGMVELYPFWNAIFRNLGFEVVIPEPSSRATYTKGQFSIPSDTACYPAKIMHGHVTELLEKGVDFVFYPCLSYNFDEHDSDNHYNCPVVAYYSELLKGNMDELTEENFLYPYLNINSPRELRKGLRKALKGKYPSITDFEMRKAIRAGYRFFSEYQNMVRAEGQKAIEIARKTGRRIMILAGRPYHIDPEIGHGIDRLATSLGFVVVSEDSVFDLAEPQNVHVLNQWTYHARLYRAAAYAAANSDTELVQLVSFGCGIDAITTDEVRSILEKGNKLYTQIKIDEITNLGAVRIRLRSLLGALEERS